LTVQRRVFDVLTQQVMLDSMVSSTSMELRRLGLEALHQILQASRHTLLAGWETKCSLSQQRLPARPFRPRLAACPFLARRTSQSSPAARGSAGEGYSALIKIAFQCMTLMCDALSPEHLRLCISTLGQFERQADTNIALTAAESLFWGVSGAIQAMRREADHEPGYSALWMHLLLEILHLCDDPRPEVRMGAIQTLF
jgi:hypothetical protein